jgi:hypothetical protein
MPVFPHHTSPNAYRVTLLLLLSCRWSGPYLRRMMESVKATHPNTLTHMHIA